MQHFIIRTVSGLISGLAGIVGGLGLVWLAGELVGRSYGVGITGVVLLVVSCACVVGAIGLAIREQKLRKGTTPEAFRESLVTAVATMLLVGIALASGAIGYAMISPRYLV